MLNLKIGEKEYNIAFGYEATLKSRILSKLAKMSKQTEENKKNKQMEENENLERIEDMLLFIPDVLLVGLQKHHEEFRYNLDTKKDYEEKKNMTFSLIEDYIEGGDNDVVELFEKLQEELTQNGFLKKMFQKELEKA